jgi:hypothetical protein
MHFHLPSQYNGHYAYNFVIEIFRMLLNLFHSTKKYLRKETYLKKHSLTKLFGEFKWRPMYDSIVQFQKSAPL